MRRRQSASDRFEEAGRGALPGPLTRDEAADTVAQFVTITRGEREKSVHPFGDASMSLWARLEGEQAGTGNRTLESGRQFGQPGVTGDEGKGPGSGTLCRHHAEGLHQD